MYFYLKKKCQKARKQFGEYHILYYFNINILTTFSKLILTYEFLRVQKYVYYLKNNTNIFFLNN